MKCIVINLERSTDRRSLATKEFENHGVQVEFFSAQDWQNLTELDYVKFKRKKFALMYWDRNSAPAELACFISHRSVWQSCLEDKDCSVVAIFEDDVLLKRGFKHSLRALEFNSSQFDIVFLENRYPRNRFKSLIQIENAFALGIVKYENIGATGYVITRYAMQRMIDRFQTMPAQVDVLLHSSWLNGLRVFTLNPASVRQRKNIHSCIESMRSHQQRTRSIFRDLIFVSIPKRIMISIPKLITYHWRIFRKI